MKPLHLHIHRRTADGFLGGEAEVLAKAKAMPLYAHFPLSGVSEDALAGWAARNGLALPYGGHVTVAYTKKPIDASKVPAMSAGMVVPPGGRSIERFDSGAIVLCLDCDALQERHAAYKKAGASWDYPSYRPHITLGYDPDGIYDNLDDIEPFDEPITLMGEQRLPIVVDSEATYDAGWEEGKHPRKSDGKFGSGGAGFKAGAQVELKTAGHAMSGKKLQVAGPDSKRPGNLIVTEGGKRFSVSPASLAAHGQGNQPLTSGKHSFNKSGMQSARPQVFKPGELKAAAERRDAEVTKAAAFKALEKHPNYSDADLAYLKGKGYSPEEIQAIWDRDKKAGHGPQLGNKNSKAQKHEMQQMGKAMGLGRK